MNNQSTNASGTDKTSSTTAEPGNTTANQAESTTSSSTPQLVTTPTSTSSVAADEEEDIVVVNKKKDANMDDQQAKVPTGALKGRTSTKGEATATTEAASDKATKMKNQNRHKLAKKDKPKKKAAKSKAREEESSDDESSALSEESESSDSSVEDSESESSDSSQDEREKRRRRRKAALRKAALKKKAKKAAALKSKKKNSSKRYETSNDDLSSCDTESCYDSDTEAERKNRKKKKAKRRRARRAESSDSDSSDSDGDTKTEATPASTTTADAISTENVTKMEKLQKELAVLQLLNAQAVNAVAATKTEDKSKSKKGKVQFKRVDEVWDTKVRGWAIKATSEEKPDEFDCVFAVRRKFDWENKYTHTVVDVKSKALQEALQEVLKDVKGVSLVEDSPSILPNLLFLYHGELKTYFRKTLKAALKKEKKKKEKKKIQQRMAHCKLLSAYLDEDYAETKKKLGPMLRAGNTTYDLLWALFKPNTIAYTPTYGTADDPRCFKVDYANHEQNWFAEWFGIDGRYLEYDGKNFGMGDFREKISKFKGVRKITSLGTYPLSYHKDADGVREKLVERGKKFVAMQGANYKFLKGLAFQKVKSTVAKININGRVMVDPAIFRRINPNYAISSMHKKNEDDDESEDGSDEEDEDSECDHGDGDNDESEPPQCKVRILKGKDGKWHVVRVPKDEEPTANAEELDNVSGKDGDEHVFTDEDLLIASPVVLGFSFSEKLWLEFSLSGIKDIEWNAQAYDSLVLPKTTKQNLRGLVSSHRFNAAKTIDDVIQGKGKGLNVVLHGPPGVGKTLTAESIAEYLKAPLYAVSAGELGTNSRALEAELNRIMDITHSWGAILLLDEADVFLEQRAAHDVHRNALVSVFLRLLEYYQGILFLTTNRVSTFDEAFQSRIHMGIRYENLNAKARKEIWQSYIRRVRDKMRDQQREGKEFKDADWEELSKKALNGRQIKNACITAQSIALAEEGTDFGIEYVRRVLDVQEDFEQDLRGGFGYRDAMRQYT